MNLKELQEHVHKKARNEAWFPLVAEIGGSCDSLYWDSYDYYDSQDSHVHTCRNNR